MIDQIEQDEEQIIEIVGHDFGVTRRTFVQIVGAGLLIAATSGPILAQERPRGGRGGGGQSRPVNLDARLHIGKDGTITVMTGKVEGGQGARAEITQAAAEELDVPIGRVQLVMGDTDLTPDDGITAGSRTTPSTLPSVREACATAHNLLVAFAKGDPTRTYADLAAADATALKQAASHDVVVTPAKEWNVLGVPTSRPGARDIVVGAHQYPADVIRPGMLYGKILRAPSYGATLTSIDLEKAKELGVTVVRDKSFVGVAAHNTAAAKQAIAALEESAKWDQPPHPSSKKLFDHLREHARAEVPTSPFKEEIAAADKRVTATFHVPYVQHCPMEPRAAVAEWDKDGKVTIWTSTQNPFGVRREVAGAFHIPEEKVRIIVPDFGGGFGGKHTGETAVEAARLAQAAKAPVAVRWTRPEELTWAAFRPAAVIDVDATLSKEGKLTSWHMVSINPGRSGVETPYQTGKTNALTIESEPPLRQASYRALGSTAHNFARESAMDELAAAAGKNPLDFRLEHLDNDRLKAVLIKAAEKFGWKDRQIKTRNVNTGIGLACATEKGSYVAACAEVIVDPVSGAVRVSHVCQAFEVGAITNPQNLRNQVTGAIIMGLGPLLREAMEFEDGKMLNASFWKYAVPRMSDVPTIDIELINRPDLPSAGAGETPLIVIAPAVRNAVHDATKQWIRQMPVRLGKSDGSNVEKT